MNQPICVCGIIAEIRVRCQEIQTRVMIIMHSREQKLTTGTARLAAVTLPDCQIRIRGHRTQAMPVEGFVTPERQSLFLFPSEEAVELTPEFVKRLGKPVTLIVPDGSWRQARKVVAREPGVKGITQVKLPAGLPSSFRLRREPNLESVSTFEAIARALGILEGAERGPEFQAALEHVFDVRVERTLWARGKLPAADCRFPIPQAAFDQFHLDGMAGSVHPAGRAARVLAKSEI